MDTFWQSLATAELIITDYATKLSFLKERTRLAPNVRFLTKEQLKSRLIGTKNYETFTYLLKDETLSFELAQSYDRELPLALSRNNTSRTALLSTLNEQLKNKNLFETDELFLYEFKETRTFVSEVYRDDNELKFLLSLFTNNVTYFTLPELKTLQVTEYSNGYLEIYDVLNEISRLLHEGVDGDKIKVVLFDRDYELIIRRLAPQFNLLFQEDDEVLINYPAVYTFYETLVSALDQLPLIIETFLNEQHLDELAATQDVLRRYDVNLFKPRDYVKFIIEKLSKTSFRVEKSNALKIVRTLPLFSDETIYFIPNFSSTYYPGQKKVQSVLNDHELKALHKLTRPAANMIHKRYLATALLNNDVRLSFAPKLGSETYKHSAFIAELALTLVDAELPKTFYSQHYINFYHGLQEDEFKHYNYVNHSLSLLRRNSTNGKYQSYSHAFKPFKAELKPIYLSYTRLNLYQNIPFDYFAEVLLKLRDDESSFSLMYGTFVHKVIEETIDLNMFDATFNDELARLTLTARERFTIMNEKELVRSAVKFRLEYVTNLAAKKTIQEEMFKVPLFGKHMFVGKIDDLIIFEHQKEDYVIVIDYKTGEATTNPNNFEHGLDLQLPIYGMLLSQTQQLQHLKVAALFIQSINGGTFPRARHRDLNTHYRDVLNYNGLFTFDLPVLKRIAAPVDEQNPIKKNLFTKDEKSVNGRLKSFELKEQYIKTATNYVYNTLERILAFDFPVQYKKIGSVDTRQYSRFKDISYIKYSDRITEVEGDDDEE